MILKLNGHWPGIGQLVARNSFCVLGLSLLTGISMSASALAQEQVEPVKLDSAMVWTLSDATLVDRGRTDMLAEGKFAHDAILEAKATATNPAGSVVPAGTFRLVLSAFSPVRDLHGQKKGVWYVRGKWTVTDEKLTPSGNARNRAGEISGQISAELAFNPTETQQKWAAKVRVPMTRIAPVTWTASSQAVKGDGMLTLDNQREGKLSLNLRLWPVMRMQQLEVQ